MIRLFTPLALLAGGLSLVALPALLEARVERADDIDQEREEVQRARGLDPDSPTALERLSRVRGAMGDSDGQLAYLLFALDAYDQTEFDDEKEKEKKLKELRKELGKIDDGLGSITSYRDAYLDDLTWALRLYAGNQGKLRSGLEVAEQVLDYRPDHRTALRVVGEILDQAEGKVRHDAERLIGRQELGRSRSFLTEWARDHRTWEEAGKITSGRYEVTTNVGYDVGQRAAHSLNQIAAHYADLYDADLSLLAPTTPVYLCRTRSEFVAVGKSKLAENPGVLAYISTSVTTRGEEVRIRSKIYGYDPRDGGRSLESLWPTLWHEASHQYMTIAARGVHAPLWINEGLATYFEGASFTERGEIRVGMPAPTRLGNLYAMLQRGETPLAELIEAEGGLTGLQYAAAWGLVYYLRHGRDEGGRRLRRDALEDAMTMLRTGKVSGPRLFREVALAPRGDTLPDFEREWSRAMIALAEEEEEPLEQAAKFAAQGIAWLEAGDPDIAKELFDEALLRDAACLPALHGLARRYLTAWEAARKKDQELADQVLVWSRRLHDAAREAEDEEMLDAAADLCASVDRVGFKKVAKARDKYHRKLESLIARTLERGQPQTALAVARLFLDDVLGTSRYEELAVELREEETLRLERPFVAFDGVTLAGLSGSPSVFRVEDGTILGAVERPRRGSLFIERPLSPRFQLEGEICFRDANTIVGFCYSTPQESGVQGFAVRPAKHPDSDTLSQQYLPFDRLPEGRIMQMHQEYQERFMAIDYDLEEPSLDLDPPVTVDTWHTFRLRRTDLDELVLELDGTPIATREIDPVGSAAHLGLLLWGGRFDLRRLEAMEFDRL